MRYVRYESATPNHRGAHTGIFGLANELRRLGRLDEADLDWLARQNAWGDAAYADPATVDPAIFDKTIHPSASCWFKVTATHLLDQVPGYLDLLDRHGVRWRERRSDDPGIAIYEDDVQVVVVRRTDSAL